MKSIKSKILIVILPLVMLGTGSIIVSFVIGLNNSTEFALQESMTATAKTAALLIQTELEGYKSVLKELAEDPVLTQPWPNATDSNYEILSQDILAHRDSILARQDLASLYVANAEGITVADSIDISNRDYFSAVKNTQSPYITDPLENRATGAFEMFAVAPIIRNGVFEGCVIAGIKPEVFSEIISHIVIGDTGSAVGVIDQTGTEIAHSQIQYVYDKINFVEMAKTDSSFADITALHQDSINGNSGFGEFNFFGEKKFMAYDRIEDSNNWGIYVVANQDVFYAQRDFYTVLGTVWAVAICIIIVIVILIVATKIAKPAKMATEQLPAIENGDFTVELKTEGNDEIAVMTNLFNSTVKKTRESLFLIHTETDNLGEIGEKLATVASDSASAVHQIAGNIESIKSQVINEAAGVAEIHATIEGIVTNVENLDGEIKKQANSIDDSMAATEEMVANIRSVTDVLEKNTAEVGKLSSAAETGRETIETTTSITEKISSKSDGLLEASNIIQGIVSQTSLLAMNAAIEAAHAGEVGKGFAVVADEIRKLAENAATQSKSITQNLQEVRTDISDLSENAQFVQNQFSSIFDLINIVQAQEAQISNMMQEQSTANEQVLQSMHVIADITKKVQSGSAEILTGNHEMQIEVQKLNEITATINSSMDEMASGAAEIRNASQNVKDMSQSTKESIELVKKNIDTFTV